MPLEELSLAELFDSSLSNTANGQKEKAVKDETVTRLRQIEGLFTELQERLKQLAADAQDEGKGYSVAEREISTGMYTMLGKRMVRTPLVHLTHAQRELPYAHLTRGWDAGRIL